MNRLYIGNNLAWLRNTKEFPDASIDLVYLDPPFNSNAEKIDRPPFIVAG
jgi:16S rRNA G966 N2-methylase RsmD